MTQLNLSPLRGILLAAFALVLGALDAGPAQAQPSLTSTYDQEPLRRGMSGQRERLNLPCGEITYSYDSAGNRTQMVRTGGAAPGLFLLDSFTDASGTSITAHTGETGATWTLQSGYSPSTPSKIDASGRLYSVANGAYRASGVPSSADYYVEATLFKVTAMTNDYIGVMARAQPAANTFYMARWNHPSGRWELYKFLAGTSTLLASQTDTFSVGQTRVLRLTVQGSDLQVAVDGVTVIGGASSPVTDSAITAAGAAGVRGSTTASQSATTGVHIDSIRAGALPPPPPFLLDTFTDASGTSITSHTGETGATWTLQTGYSPSPPSKIDASGQLYSVANGAYRASGVPSSADYYVEAVLFKVTSLTNDYVGVMARAQPAANTFYMARWNHPSGRWELYKFLAGTSTLLASQTDTFSVGQTRVLRLTVQGSDLQVAVDGVTVIGGAGSPVTDSAITAAGAAGVRGSTTASQSATTGVHIDSITASNLAP